MNAIDKKHLSAVLAEYKKDKASTVARHALSNGEIANVALDKDSVKDMDFNFDINIKTMTATNQKQSGRCWIFAATNVLREMIGKKKNIPFFELSQSYIAFYDKLEKLNYVLEAHIELIDKDYDDRTLQFILQSGIGDGGQWDMFVNVVKKYGVCPKNVYPETYTSSSTRYINSLANAELRKFASEAHALYKKEGLEAVRKLKDSYLDRFYRALVSCYGLPPEKFDFEYTDKDEVYHIEKGYTPESFYKEYVGDMLDEYVSVINAPTKDKPFNKSFTVKYLGNVAGGKKVTHLNLPMERMKELILAQLKDGQIVWFGSDVAFYGDRPKGIWDDNDFDFKSLLDLDYKMDKGESLDYRESQMNHAMCITGVALKDGVPSKWKIENSWGEDAGKKGYYIMSSSWFDQYTYQAVINKKYLTKEELAAYNAEPIELKPWDPMGSLAK
ncbi:MAG: C1 family peptidase [Bacilli bacterium]|nr:C1 family peptidase [Bacilli bacterium]